MKHTLLGQLLARRGIAIGAFDTKILIPCDHIYGHDRNTFKIMKELDSRGVPSLKHSSINAADKLRLFMDHYSPPPNAETAALHLQQRALARAHDLTLFDEGSGVGHQLALEQLVSPWEIAVGVDSHTCTVGAIGALGLHQPPIVVSEALQSGYFPFYIPRIIRIELLGELPRTCSAKDIALRISNLGKLQFQDKLMEFGGSGLKTLSIADRATLANLTTDFGARSGLCESDSSTNSYMKAAGRESDFPLLAATLNSYEEVIEIDLTKLAPHVSRPGSIFDSISVDSMPGPVQVDVVALGSCTNGRLQDFAEFLDALGSSGIAPGVRVVATPASRHVLKELMTSGMFDRLIGIGATVNPPGCGPCMGLHQGYLGDGEVCVATGSRNTAGRMGSKTAQIYLAGPKLAGLVARTGRLDWDLFRLWNCQEAKEAKNERSLQGV
jgi:3-isopropylmalate/(R)-2-methylmalate dehydratase large subunit